MNQFIRFASRTLVALSLLLFGATALSGAAAYANAIALCDIYNPSGCGPVQEDQNGKKKCGGSCNSGLATTCNCKLLTSEDDNGTVSYYCECKSA